MLDLSPMNRQSERILDRSQIGAAAFVRVARGTAVRVLVVWLYLLSTSFASEETVFQSARDIPVAHEVDVVVLGGTVGGVAAAVEAASKGARVFLAAPRTYLGEDLCGTLRLWREHNQPAAHGLSQKIFGDQAITTPLRVKKVLELAMIDSGAEFLLACYPTDVLVDSQGQFAGVVLANRAGRQAVLANVVIDATERATVARMAGAKHRPWVPGDYVCRRVVLAPKADKSDNVERFVNSGQTHGADPLFYHEYALQLDLGDGSFSALAQAEQTARETTFLAGQLRASERLTFLPSDQILGDIHADQWQPDVPWQLGHFRSQNMNRVFVLSGAADLPSKAAEQLRLVDVCEEVGRMVGRAAAAEAQRVKGQGIVSVAGSQAPPEGEREIREQLRGLRPTGSPERTVPAASQTVRVLAKTDVLIVGGGTSGACAAIGAARRGARVLVVEYQEGLGGVGTVGLIGKAYHGRDLGFTREVPFCDAEFSTEDKMEWFRREIRAAGGEIWLGVLGCGAVVEGDRVVGAMIATPLGRGAVLADVIIDATGNGDVAVAAGAESMYGSVESDLALQGTGLPKRPLGKTYVNTDYLLVDESDLMDTWRALVGSRLAVVDGAYDMGSFIQTRERRRIVGDHILSYLDQIAGRTYPDAIVLSGSDYDSHGYPSEPFFALIPHTEKTLKANHPAPGGTCFTPYRCLLPKRLEGILVTGLAISMYRDASAMVRMQKDMHNQGYAAGVAAAMAVAQRCTPRQVDVRELQAHLVDIGNLPESVLGQVDSFPLPQADIDLAIRRITDPQQSRANVCQALAVVLTHSDRALSGLRDAFDTAMEEDRFVLARLLGFLGDSSGVPVLIERLEAVDQWDAKVFQGKMAEYAHLPTPIDSVILALGYSGDRRAIAAVLKKLEMLNKDVTLSHHRAVALALEQLGDAAAAEPLAKLLEQPGMRGHVMTSLEPLHDQPPKKRRRNEPLREIVLARALYHCGDWQGIGEDILNEYRHDLRGLFARHAEAVLNAK
jgi:flavin-dependent dehydrogenase